MMCELKNCRNKLICKVDHETGLVETSKRDDSSRVWLEVGQKMEITKQDICTTLIRTHEGIRILKSVPIRM